MLVTKGSGYESSNIHINYSKSVYKQTRMKTDIMISVLKKLDSNFFRFVNKRASYPFGIISLAHAPVNVTDFSIGSINCVRHFPQT